MRIGEHAEAPEVLASYGTCRVEHCTECRVVHVHVGSVSLRLEPAAFLSVCATLLEAARAMPASDMKPQ